MAGSFSRSSNSSYLHQLPFLGSGSWISSGKKCVINGAEGFPLSSGTIDAPAMALHAMRKQLLLGWHREKSGVHKGSIPYTRLPMPCNPSWPASPMMLCCCKGINLTFEVYLAFPKCEEPWGGKQFQQELGATNLGQNAIYKCGTRCFYCLDNKLKLRHPPKVRHV